MNEGNRVVKNAFWIVGAQVIKALLGLVISMFTARYLGPSNYGLINYAASIVAFAAPIMYLGLKNILGQEIVTASLHRRYCCVCLHCQCGRAGNFDRLPPIQCSADFPECGADRLLVSGKASFQVFLGGIPFCLYTCIGVQSVFADSGKRDILVCGI